MLAETQFRMTSSDLEVVLAVVRARTLIEAGKRLGLDASTVFRSVRRLEKGLGQRLFERSRSGSQPTELALKLVQHAERIETEIETARTTIQEGREGLVTGMVKIATTDTLLHRLVLPALANMAAVHPLLLFELSSSNEFASLVKREADIALRVTRQPPAHLIGKLIGRVRMAVFGPRPDTTSAFDPSTLSRCAWVAPDDALPGHPSVRWRKRHYPLAAPRCKVNSILSVVEAIASGLGVGLVPLYLAQHRNDLVQVTDPIDECETQLWLLTHAESRHITRVATTYSYLAENLSLE